MTAGGPAAADLRLLPVAGAAWLGAGIAVAAPGPGWVLAVGVGLWLLTAVLAAARLPGSWRGIVVLALAGGALAITSVAGQAVVRSPPVLNEAAHAGRTVELVVAVSGRSAVGRIPGTAESARIAGTTVTLAAPVLLFGQPGDGAIRGAQIGSLLRVTGTLQVADPGEDVAYLVFVRGNAERAGAPPPLLATADAVRRDFRKAASGLPGDRGALLPGLAIGDTSSVSATLSDAMKTASLSHLTAVSPGRTAPSWSDWRLRSGPPPVCRGWFGWGSLLLFLRGSWWS